MTTLARVLVADPAWPFKDKQPGGRPGAETHYKCMSINDIIRMPLPPIADDAVLFLWRVSSMVEEAYHVLRVWGFVPKSEIVWNKTDASGEKDAMGLGHIVRGSHETCIVATRGKKIETQSKRERTSFRAPIGEHSEKPEAFYRIVERLYPLELWPEAHVELFARRRRKGWIQFGDELPPLEPSKPLWCILHGEPIDTCRQCSIVATSTELRGLLGSEDLNALDWKRVRRRLAQTVLDDYAANQVTVAPNGAVVP